MVLLGCLAASGSMRRRSLALLGLLAALVFVTGGPPAQAQYRRGGPFSSFFDIFRPPPYYPPQYRMAPRKRIAPARPRTVIVQDSIKPKVDPGTFVVVVGDSLAELLAQGLDEAFANKPDIAIVNKTKGDSGLVRADFYDWPKAANELLSGQEKITLGVMMIGVNDRQAIKENGETIEPSDPRWEQVYGARIDAIARAFADKKIPLIWVGLPPMKNGDLSADMEELNTLFRDHVQRGSGIFVDVWEAFADDDNRYSAYGPGLSGQYTKLRTPDGVHFTKAGARKLAHFVDLEINRLVDTQPTVVALPAQPQNLDLDPNIPGNIERMIDAAIKPLPEPKGAVALPVKPLAGPIITLTRQDVAPGGALATAPKGRAPGEAGALIERVFDEGRLPEPRAGRADDFHWPPSGS